MHKHLLKASKVIATALERKDAVRIYVEEDGKIILEYDRDGCLPSFYKIGFKKEKK